MVCARDYLFPAEMFNFSLYSCVHIESNHPNIYKLTSMGNIVV